MSQVFGGPPKTTIGSEDRVLVVSGFRMGKCYAQMLMRMAGAMYVGADYSAQQPETLERCVQKMTEKLPAAKPKPDKPYYRRFERKRRPR